MTAIIDRITRIGEILNSMNLRKDWHKIVYTAIMCYIQFAFGITCTSVGPCLVDLKNIFHQKDMRLVLYYSSINSIGYIIGSLCKYFYYFD